MTDEQRARPCRPSFCFACSKRLPESLVCERCGADSSGWQEWVPIAVCMNGHVVGTVEADV